MECDDPGDHAKTWSPMNDRSYRTEWHSSFREGKTKMRKFLALAAVLLGLSLSAPASAQLGGLVGILNGGRDIGSTVGYGCTGSGMSQIACQAQRATSIGQQIDYQRQSMRQRRQASQQREQARQQREQRIDQALARACKAGDEESCRRARPVVDTRQDELRLALLDACDAGDDVSCDRARDISRRQTADRRDRWR